MSGFGLDDYFGAGGTLSDIRGRVVDRLPDAPSASTSSAGFDICRMDAFAPKAVDYIVEHVIPASSLVFMSGNPGSYKTFNALDLIWSACTGIDWHGHATKSVAVLFVPGEGVTGIPNRLHAWRQAHGMPDTSRAYLAQRTVQLMDATDVDRFIDEVTALPEMPKVIVIDALSNSAVGADENAASDMSRLVANAKRIRDATGATILILHHNNKLGEYRGSSALFAGADAWMSTTKSGDKVTITCLKQREAEPFPPITLRRQVQVIGTDATGADITSLVFIPANSAIPLSDKAKAALAILCQAGRDGLTTTEWETACCGKDMGRSTFHDVKKELEGKSLVAGGGKRGAKIVPTDAGLAIAKVGNSGQTFTKMATGAEGVPPDGPATVQESWSPNSPGTAPDSPGRSGRSGEGPEVQGEPGPGRSVGPDYLDSPDPRTEASPSERSPDWMEDEDAGDRDDRSVAEDDPGDCADPSDVWVDPPSAHAPPVPDLDPNELVEPDCMGNIEPAVSPRDTWAFSDLGPMSPEIFTVPASCRFRMVCARTGPCDDHRSGRPCLVRLTV